ncbi:hypothetical protein [Rehaibacterium terrae]|jgi:transposase|uniref:Helix-turn-helix domain-containing protein n=1 Tax=Rehaibacterium terrae TaxID=1341696 RepID=A0A7W7V7I6_9GAMM|nr:hypothetical protein [Rehaibacterium terrae]MBB5014682.1 hypothetical protein [Rehaibacterium terrae]
MRPGKIERVKGHGSRSAKSRRDALLRLLHNEGLDTVSRELKVTAAKLIAWREAFVASGVAALKAREADARDEAIERLKAMLDKMTMHCELRRDAIRSLKPASRWAERGCRNERSDVGGDGPGVQDQARFPSA